MMHSALVSVAQSIPATGAAAGAWVLGLACCMCASWLVVQSGSTRWCRDVLVGRSLIGARWRAALSPLGTSWCPPDPAELTLALTGRAPLAVVRWAPGRVCQQSAC